MAELDIARERVRASLKRRDAQIETFATNLSAFLERNTRKILKEVESGEVKAAEAAQRIASLNAALEQAGLKKQLDGATKLYFDELEEVLGIFKSVTGSKPILSNADLDLVEQLIVFDTDRVSGMVDDYTGKVKPIMLQSVITGERPDVSSIAEKYSESMRRDIQTELDTALMAFNRTVNTTKAAEVGIEFFLYTGPDDKITRPFCQEHVNKAYTLAELGDLDNGQGLPVPQYLGGYNCRHYLVPLDSNAANQYRD